MENIHKILVSVATAFLISLGAAWWSDHNMLVKHDVTIAQTEELSDELKDYFRVQRNRAEKDAERFERILDTFPTPTPGVESED